MVKIAVCVKQIPLIEDIRFDLETKRIKRDGPNVISAFDLRALALAVQLKDRLSAQTVAVTMGPPTAREALLEALAMGIDRAVHLQDPAFAGADTLATARALARWLSTEHIDLILTGKYSLDAETGQVGPQIAELLGFAQITGVRRLEITDGLIRAERESDEGFEEVQCALPAVLTCAERLIKPIKVSPELRAAAQDELIETVGVGDLGGAINQYGAPGSPTIVGRIRWLERMTRDGKRLTSGSPAELAESVASYVEAWDIPAQKRPCGPPVSHSHRRAFPGRDVFVVCETDAQETLTSASLELITNGGYLADQVGGALGAVLIGRTAERQADVLASYGTDYVHVLDMSPAEACSADALAVAMAELMEDQRPWALLVPASERGRDWAPRLAARLGLGLVGDAVGLEIDERDQLVALKPAFGGSIVADICSRTRPQMATVRPGMLSLGAPVAGRRAEITLRQPKPNLPLSHVVRAHVALDPETASLERAKIVVGVGMGIGGPETLVQVREFARALGASICATRRVTDAGWLPRQVQVGLTGKGLNARLYIALGVGGSPNHTIGITRVGRVIAVNSDPNAVIFESADLAVVADCHRILPELVAAFRRRTDVRRLAQKPAGSPA